MAGRSALLPARDDGGPRCAAAQRRGGEPGPAHGELITRRDDDALLHHIVGLDPHPLDPPAAEQRKESEGMCVPVAEPNWRRLRSSASSVRPSAQAIEHPAAAIRRGPDRAGAEGSKRAIPPDARPSSAISGSSGTTDSFLSSAHLAVFRFRRYWRPFPDFASGDLEPQVPCGGQLPHTMNPSSVFRARPWTTLGRPTRPLRGSNEILNR